MKKITKYFIKIENDGEIDVSGLHLMGVSSKRDEDKIGFFGSGNKYAFALLLRKKIPFWIYSGKKQIKVSTEPVMFREKLFDRIIINGEKTSLTTAMGIDWENWFAVREIYCNALDEGGAKIDVVKSKNTQKGKTSIFIELEESLKDFFKDINSYILVNDNKIEEVSTHYGKVSVYQSDKQKFICYRKGKTSIFIELEESLKDFFKDINSYILVNDNKIEEVSTHYGKVSVYQSDKQKFICYRKGIRIYPQNNTKSLYWYNFNTIEINESRTYKYEHQIKEQIASFFAVTKNREIILDYLKNYSGNFEEYLRWEYVQDSLSDEWQKILYGKRVYPKSLASLSGDFEGKMNSFIVPDELAKKISNELKGVDVIGQDKKKTFLEVTPNENEQRKLDTALQQLKKIDFNITSRIKIVKPMIDDVVGWYEKEDDTIYLAQKHLTTVPYIKNTILEEHFHMKGYVDGQREFVSFLIDELIRAKETSF